MEPKIIPQIANQKMMFNTLLPAIYSNPITRQKILTKRKIYPFETKLDNIAAEDTVEYPYASGSQEWNGYKALLIASATLIKAIIVVNVP